MAKLTVLGLDGAGFELIKPWLEDGELPTLSKLIDEGQADTLKSVYPPVTCPSWRCFSTGVNPGKHGVFWWEQVNRDTHDFNIPTSSDFDSPDIWDYLGDEGYESAIMNMPTTFPPEKLNGWIISGGGGVDNNKYTYPPNLQKEIENKFGYEVFIDGSSENIGNNPERVEEVLDLIETRFEVADYLRREYNPDFLSFVIFYTNVFHHFFWDDDITKRVWKKIDTCLSEFIDDSENIMIISDHGSNKIHHTFNINTWLEQQGYLKMNNSVSDGFYQLGITRDRMIKLSDKIGIKGLVKRFAPRDLIEIIPNSDGSVVGRGKAEKINWKDSKAFASGQGPIYILSENKEERAEIKNKIRSGLQSLTTPSGKGVTKEIYDAEQIYEGAYVNEGPDMVIEQADNIHIRGALGAEQVFEQPDKWKAENHQDGLVILNGTDVRGNSGFNQPPSIYDIAPTILHWYDSAIPQTMDGRVLSEIFKPKSDPATRPIKRKDFQIRSKESENEDDQKQMRERLQDLGYLSE